MTNKIISRKWNGYIKHGMRRHLGKRAPEYTTWIGMKARCLNEANPAYDRYGGRGITIYEPWIESFQEFLDYIGHKPEPTNLYSLDRIDNNKGYEPGNVRWATHKDQANNRRPEKPETKEDYVSESCKVCGKEFMKHPTKRKHYFCGKQCNNKWFRELYRGNKGSKLCP